LRSQPLRNANQVKAVNKGGGGGATGRSFISIVSQSSMPRTHFVIAWSKRDRQRWALFHHCAQRTGAQPSNPETPGPPANRAAAWCPSWRLEMGNFATHWRIMDNQEIVSGSTFSHFLAPEDCRGIDKIREARDWMAQPRHGGTGSRVIIQNFDKLPKVMPGPDSLVHGECNRQNGPRRAATLLSVDPTGCRCSAS
jgi:hypothetical protein